MEESDEELVSWSRAGDPVAFVEVFWRHGSAVHAYLARRSGRQDADDLLSEVWLRAFKGRGGYDREFADARPWLYGIARHVLHAHWRQIGRPAVPILEPAPLDYWQEVDARLDATAQREALRSALARLPDGEREVLLLVVWEQLTPAEAALTLGIPQGTARSRLHRALVALRAEPAPISPVLLRMYPKEA